MHLESESSAFVRLARPFLTLLLLCCVVFAVFACSGCNREGAPVKFPPVVTECGSDILDIVGKVVRILTGGERVTEQLDAMALKYGAEKLACAIDYAQHDMRGVSGAQDPQMLRAAERGDDYLKLKGTRVDVAHDPDSFLWIDLAPPQRMSRGFVPIERMPADRRPWHVMLASARGVRS